MIVFLFGFLFAFPIWMFGIPLYLASAIRQRYPQATALSASLVIGAISTLTSLAYRRCESGMWHGFDDSYPTTFIYRGFPFAWLGWNSFDFPPQPMGHLLLNLVVWTAIAFGSLSLFSLIQLVVQWKMASSDKQLIIGAVLVALPLMIAGFLGGVGC
jgi:hypothetical protein